MEIKYLGQNCFLFNYKNKNIITDPFYNFGREDSQFDISAQKIDYVLITHAHEDHIADVEEVLTTHPEAIVIGQPEICGHFAHPNSVDLNIGGTTMIEDLKITMVKADHTSSFPDGSYGGVASGYILNDGENIIYLAGDTGIMADMELFPKYFGKIDLSILPIGGHYTMDAKTAAFAAANLLKTKKVIGCHFDTFEIITIDHQKSLEIFKNSGVKLILPKPGESFEV